MREGGGVVDNISVTIYEDPKLEFWFDERTNAGCFRAKDVTIDVKIPKLLYDFDMDLFGKDTTLIYFNFMADYYVNRGLFIETCYTLST